MVTRYGHPSGYATPSESAHAQMRDPQCILPPIRSLNLGHNGAPDMERRHSQSTNPGFAVGPSPRGGLERLPSSDSFHASFPPSGVAYRGRESSARKDSLNGVAMAPPSALPSPMEFKEECPRCFSRMKPFSECPCGGYVEFRHPFLQNGKRLADDFDDCFDPRPTSRRGSAAQGSTSSSSPGPSSRRGSYTAFPGMPKPTRRPSSAQTVKSAVANENQRQDKAEREKGSRKELQTCMKRMEVYLMSIGWKAHTDLNANNKKNSGLNYKKSEILELMTKRVKDGDEELMAVCSRMGQVLAMYLAGKDLDREELEKLCEHAQRRKDEIKSASGKETALIREWRAWEDQMRLEEEQKPRRRGRKNRQCPTPTPTRSVSPQYTHFPGGQVAF